MKTYKVLIFGHTGQDGFFLRDFLEKKGHLVSGFSKKELLINSKSIVNHLNILSRVDVSNIIKKVEPDHIYYLSAFHNSSQNNNYLPTRDLYELSLKTNVEGFLNTVDAVLNTKPDCKVFYASSSHVFGNPQRSPQTEQHPINPLNIYGQSKALGMEVASYYRNHHNLFCSSGILYNHESNRRNNFFFSKKISLGIKNIIQGKIKHLKVGSLDSIVDWSYVTDVVEAMYLSLSTKIPHDFIIASGKGHRTGEFIKAAFNTQSLDYKDYVSVDKKFEDKTSTVVPRIGNPGLIKKITGWKPKYSFYAMVQELIRIELNEKK